MKKEKIEITNDIANRVEEEIRTISTGVKKLLESKLTRRTIVLLIQDATPRMSNNNQKLSNSEVDAVLEGILNLESKHFKKQK